jgi:hypothetical protein
LIDQFKIFNEIKEKLIDNYKKYEQSPAFDHENELFKIFDFKFGIPFKNLFSDCKLF